MTALVSPYGVLASRSELPKLALEVDNWFFCRTWMASHVRLVDLIPSVPVSLSLLIAHALTRNPGRSMEIPIDEWLGNTQFVPSDSGALSSLIAHALGDIHDAESPRQDLALISSLRQLVPEKAASIHSFEIDKQRKGPYSPYEYGPTYRMFWTHADRFAFLEVHNES